MTIAQEPSNPSPQPSPRRGEGAGFCLPHSLLLQVVTIAALFAMAPAATGDEPTAQSKVLVLFDGKSLDGWKKTESYKAGEIKVEDGAIVLAAGGPMTGITCTRSDLPLTNYEMIYEAKRTAGNDFFAAATFPVEKSYITLVNGGWGGSVTGLSSINGADASENETNRFVKYQNDVWYRFRVRVTEKAIRGWIDDKEILAVNIEGQQVKTRVEVRGSQPLGFASWRSASAVRKIEVRPLTPAEITANTKVE